MKRLYVVALALVLAGCGGDPPPTAPPPPSPSPTSTAPAAPVMPEGAKADSKSGAREFARYYIESLNFAQATGTLHDLRKLEGPTCSSCTKVGRAIQRIYANGGRIVGGQFALEIDDIVTRPDLQGWTVFGLCKFSPETVVRPGRADQHLKGGRVPMTLVVVLKGDTPVVAEWSRGA